MAVSTITNKSLRCVEFTIPSESTLPITYTVPGITANMSVINVYSSNLYVFQGLTATTGADSVTIDGTRWGEYDDDVTIQLIFATTINVTATPVVNSGSGEGE